MASTTTTTTTSGSPQIQNSGSEEVMDQRKRKRMESNRESARRSRMRKQKHLDDLTSEIARMRQENDQILTIINVTTHEYVNVEAQNSVLIAQMMELTQRLGSLTGILNYISSSTTATAASRSCLLGPEELSGDGFSNSPWNLTGLNQHHPIMTSVEMFDY